MAHLKLPDTFADEILQFLKCGRAAPDGAYLNQLIYAIEADYGPDGNFLDRVVINKLVGETAWLFNSDIQPYKLEAFNHSGKHEIPLSPETLTQALADWYRMPQAKIAAALALV